MGREGARAGRGRGRSLGPELGLRLHQRGCGQRDRRSARGLITFALGFIPVYSNLLEVAGGTGRAGGERPGGTWAWRGVRESSQAAERWSSREREKERDGERERQRGTERHTQRGGDCETERERDRERGGRHMDQEIV